MKHYPSTFSFLLFSLFVSFQPLHTQRVQTNGPYASCVNALTLSGTNFFAGTESGGIWRRPLSEMTAVETPPEAHPTTYSLEQNYPNPFNPSTVISHRYRQMVL